MILPLCAMEKQGLKRVDRCFDIGELKNEELEKSVKLKALYKKLTLEINTYKDEEIEADLIPVHSPVKD